MSSSSSRAPRGPVILFISLSAYSSMGGIQRFNQRIIRALAENSVLLKRRVKAFQLYDKKNDAPEVLSAVAEGFSGQKIPFFKSIVSELLNCQVLLLGHINLLPIAILAKAIKPSAKIIVFGHGIELWNAPLYRKKKFFEPLLLRKLVTKFAVVSNYTAASLSLNFGFPNDRIVIFPNAIDGSFGQIRRRDDSGPLLAVTRLQSTEREKNVDKIIKALPLVRLAYPDIRLEIVGDGDLIMELQALVKNLGLVKNVRFHGKLSDDDLKSAYERATVFVLPSVKEGFGIVFLEAWLYGLPVIAADATAIPEVVTHGQDGFLINPSDIEQLANSLINLLSHKELRFQMAFNGQNKIMEKYQHHHFSARLINLVRTSK